MGREEYNEMKHSSLKDDFIHYGLLVPVLLLILVGFLAQYGAFHADPSIKNISPLLLKHLLWTLLGLFCMFLLMFIPIKFLWKAAPVIFVITLLLMGLLIKFYDPAMAEATNTKRWLRLGSFTLQPSEFMKIGYVLMLAYLVTSHHISSQVSKLTETKQDWWLFTKMTLISLPVALLMFIQKDFGSSLVFLSIFLGILIISGCSWKLLLPVFGTIGILGLSGILLVFTEHGRSILTYFHFQPYQFNRIKSWLDPFAYADSIAFQQARGLTAIGSGQMFGRGLNHLKVYVPVRESDMIFTVIAEAFGFVGTSILLLLFFYLIYQMLIITFSAKKEFYAYITTGIIMYFLFHIVENIGSNIGLLPLTGIPLPFLSQGGTAYITNFIAVGLVLSMHREKLFDKQEDDENYMINRQVHA